MDINEKNIPYVQELLTGMYPDLVFRDEDHSYTWTFRDGSERRLISTTTLIHHYSVPFEEHKWAAIKAKSYDCDVSEVLGWWSLYNEFASFSGGLVHDVNEEFYNRIIAGEKRPDYWSIFKEGKFAGMVDYMRLLDERVQGYMWLVERINVQKLQKNQPLTIADPFRERALGKQFLSFYESTKEHLVPVKMETVVGNPYLLHGKGIGGMLDCLFFDRKTGLLTIYDYKTNRNFKYMSDRAFNNMTGPFAEFKDLDEAHYTVQMSVYQYLLSLAFHTHGVRVKFGRTQLVRLSETVPDFQLVGVDYKPTPVMNALYMDHGDIKKKVAEEVEL